MSGQSGTNRDSFRLPATTFAMCGGTRDASSSLWVSHRIDSNHCGSAADLSENGCARISKICEATVLEKPVAGLSLTEQSRTMEGR